LYQLIKQSNESNGIRSIDPIISWPKSQHMDSKSEIKQIVIELFIATDRQDWEQVSLFFADEVLLDYSSMNGDPAISLSPEQIITAWKGIIPGFEHTHHQLGNFSSTISDDKAKVFCYGTASHYLNDPNGNLWIVVGTYDFDLKKSDDSWKITSMAFNFKYQDGNVELAEKAINKLK